MRKTPEYQEAVDDLKWWLRLSEDYRYTMWSMYVENGGASNYSRWWDDQDYLFREPVREMQRRGVWFEEERA